MKRPEKPEQFAAAAMKRLEGASRSKNKCKICAHLLRNEIDEMLVAGIRYASILSFARERGLQISLTGISRHRNTHLLGPGSDVLSQIEDAIKKHLARCLRELKGRKVESLSVEELIASAQTAVEALAVVTSERKGG